jgi:hypothetical protein
MAEKKYKVVCYMRIDPEDQEPMTMAEAAAEVENLELMQPENKYTVELWEGDDE